MTNQPTKTCEYCNDIYSKNPKLRWEAWDSQRFCSPKCRAKVLPPPKRGESKFIKCKHCKKEYRIRMAVYKRAKRHYCSMDCRVKDGGMSTSREKHWNWKGGVTPENHRLRNTPEYKEWRDAVYRRDRWTCQECGAKKSIVAHHIKTFNEYPELRHSVPNGVTLCRSCHKKEHLEIGKKTRFKHGI